MNHFDRLALHSENYWYIYHPEKVDSILSKVPLTGRVRVTAAEAFNSLNL